MRNVRGVSFLEKRDGLIAVSCGRVRWWRQRASEVAVDVHALVQDAHDVDDRFGGDPIEQRV